MRSRNRHRSPRLSPIHPAVIGWVRHGILPLPKGQQLPTRRPFVASVEDQPACWWKLNNPTKPGASRRIWWAPMGARRWRECPEFIRPKADGEVCIWTDYPTEFGKEDVEDILLMLHKAALIQANERLNRRAIDARRRRALKPPHPPRRCACCGQSFTPKRTDAKCCSSKCRAKLSRKRAAVAA